jgi:endonuclease/exonuclease/phosphatase (EEP) superfamily protein YafD
MSEEMLIIFFMISCNPDTLENLDDVDLDDIATSTLAPRNSIESTKDDSILRGADHPQHLHEERLKNEDLLIRSPNYYLFNKWFSKYFSYDKLYRSTIMSCNSNRYVKSVCFILDTTEVHKGSMLYAAPQNCNTDHFVIIISTFKGKAICLTPSYSTFYSNRLYLLYHIYVLLKHNIVSLTLIISMSLYTSATFRKCNKNSNVKIKLGKKKLQVQCLNSHTLVKLRTPNKNHLDNYIFCTLMHDIETNPGPAKRISLKIITFNCRGLNNIDKCRLLLNKISKIIDNGQAVVMLQETMIVTDNYLKLAWRGKYIHTPGTGNSQGCVTLLPSTVEIISTEHFGTRGHYAQVTGLTATDETVAIYNIYAPNGFGQEKLEFMNSLFEKISTHAGNTILGGDINTTLSNNDRHNKGVTTAERRIAGLILDKIIEYDLTDVWGDAYGFTWRRGQVMSKLDRIFYRLENYTLKSNEVDWTVASSDHAAVIAILEHKELTKHKNDHVKLDNEIIKNPTFLSEIREYVTEQLATATHMNPHLKLEFFKMTVRTITLAIMKRERQREISELAEINGDILTLTGLLTRPQSQTDARIITIELENLNNRKEQLLQSQGEKLAHYAKSRWYNDGEKSNKYFLNLLKRRSQNNEMNKLVINDTIVTNPTQIRAEVTNFYERLYNSTESVDNSDHLLRHMFTVTQDENDYMSRMLTLDELWLNLKNTKATTPGPDGMSNTYLKKLWPIAGPLILNAWKYSLEVGELPPSHRTSILRLIPKQGKDVEQIKNWRPITLSNCDHKLITRTYNSRLLRVIGAHITPTQTAYIKGRNISDNLRMINSAVKLSEVDDNINGTVIALDAQKAFDSVNHDYIAAVLQRCALTNSIPLFRLLYKGLHNNIMINGRIGPGYNISNGVKQGDALSCSLFVLAIEPVLRNIIANDNIIPLSSPRIEYIWPKVLGYADDLTIITSNDNRCIEEVFTEYGLFTKASGLKLNADKTEIFTIQGRNHDPDVGQLDIRYLNQQYLLNRLDTIKINGIIFKTNRLQMQVANLNIMINKMQNHFLAWSHRSLSLLGKVQIIKTFGISQYLYTLAAINLDATHWKRINKFIYKFIWNKNLNVAPAPHRIRKEVVLTSVEQGGFGMVDLESVMNASRIKRFSQLMEYNTHPIADLQNILCRNNPTSATPVINIDDVTTSVLHTLHKHNMNTLNNAPDYCTETDTNLQNMILNSNIKDICLRNKLRGREIATLTHRQVNTVQQALLLADNSIHLAIQVLNPNLQRHVRTLLNIAGDIQLPRQINAVYLFHADKMNMVRALQLTSRNIRYLLTPTKYLNNTKLMNISIEESINIYKKIHNVRSIQNKTKVLRLVHGDVYCGARLKKFGLNDNDRCIRCFAEETITHLLIDCPYTQEIWLKLGINPTSLTDILMWADKVNIEIISQFLSEIVFRKKVLPIDVLIRTIYTSFSKGLCRNKKVIDRANLALNSFQITGIWNMALE